MKVIKRIAGFVAIAGFVLMLGTAGESDNGVIGFNEVVTRCLIGLGMMVIGMMAAYFIEEKENA